AFTRRKIGNRLLQFIVLHFELGLMNSKFVDESYGVVGERPQDLIRLSIRKRFLGARAQSGKMI
ncbi:MAG: hypothetical protein ACI8W7_002571, partial [Gammaproteobacteria bacterium]